MQKLLLVVVSCLALATPAFAQTQPLADDDLKARFAGKTVDIGADGVATYKPDGSYEYFSRQSGQTSRGKYTMAGGRICADFSNGQRRCDRIVQDGGKVYLMNNNGAKYEMKAR